MSGQWQRRSLNLDHHSSNSASGAMMVPQALEVGKCWYCLVQPVRGARGGRVGAGGALFSPSRDTMEGHWRHPSKFQTATEK